MFATSDSLAGVRFPQLETRKAMIIINAQNDSLYEADDIYICKNHDFVGRLKTLVPYFRRIGDIIWVHTEMSQTSNAPSPDAAKTEEAMKKNGDKSRKEQKVQDDQLEDDTERTDNEKEVSETESLSAKSPHNGSPSSTHDYQSYHPSSRTKSMMQRASAQARAHQRTANMGVFNGDQGDLWEENMIKSRKGQQKKFYVGGTYGAETCDELKPVVDESADIMLVKQYYSAFDQTALLTALRTRLVTELYICGSLTNVGVYSTAADAVQHGFTVTLIEDCLGYRSEEKHEEAMRQMADIMGANGIDSEELIEESGGREVPDDEEPMFQGPGLNGISVGGLTIVHSQSKVEQVTRSAIISHAGSDESFPKSRGKAKPLAKIIVKEPSSPNTVDEVQSPAKSHGDKQTRKTGNKLSNHASPLPSPGISSTRSRGSLMASAPVTMGPEDSIGAGDSKIILKVLRKPLSEDAFTLLKEEVDWQTMHHRGGMVPRLVAVQGQIGDDGGVPVYRHPADESPPLLEFSPTVQKIRKQVEKAIGQPLNHALIQLYRDGVDNISEHSDKTLDVVRGSSIINLSLGAQRVMTLRTKAAKQQKGAESPASIRQTQRIPMPHNSAFILGSKSNAQWLHGVRADKRPLQHKSEEEKSYGGERISITFRHIGTFMDEDTRKIWGQGARGKTRKTAGTIPRGDTAEMEAMVQAFGKENHEPDFDWDAHYGKGFDVINLINDKAKLSLCKDTVANLRVQLSLSEKSIPYTLKQPSRPQSPESQNCKPQLQPWTHGLSNIQNLIFEDADEDATITEGDLAILFYLETVNPSAAPQKCSADKARNISALTFTRTTQSNELLYLWRQLKALPQADNGSPRAKKRPTTPNSTPLSEFKTDMKIWEEYAKDSEYIAGDSWTVIDCAFWPVLHEIAERWECFGRKQYPRLYAYHERVLEREAVKALMEQSEE